MNSVVLMGRLTRDPYVRYSQGDNPIAVARYSLAVDRRRSKNQDNNQPTADFINCIAFGKNGEFAEKYLHKGVRICINGHIQTGSYKKEGQTIYTTDVVVDSQEFCESRAANDTAQNYAPQDNTQQNDNHESYQPASRQASAPAQPAPEQSGIDGFMNMPDGIDEDLPFN